MKGWEVKALAEVCQIRPPKAEVRRKLAPTDLVSFVPMNDLGDDAKTFEPRETKALADVEGSYTYFAENDVLLAKITPCFENGKLGIARGLRNGVGFGSSEFVVLRPNMGLDPEYLYYFLSRSSFREDGAKRMTGAVGHKRIPKELVEQLQIPLPPLDEQRRIVAILDEAFAGLAVMRQHAEANLANARALFDSHLNAVFSQPGEGWVTEGLNEHVRFVDYRGKTPPKRDAGIRLITAKNVKMGFIRREPEEFIDPAAYDEWMTRGFPKKGDVLFTTEAPLGNVAQLDTDEKVVIGQRLITMQPVPNVLDRKFLAFMLTSGPLQDAIHAKATGATVLGIKAKLLKFIPISYPQKLADQRAIADRIEEISLEVARLESLYRQKLVAIDELKQSILHRAFSGALNAKDALAA